MLRLRRVCDGRRGGWAVLAAVVVLLGWVEVASAQSQPSGFALDRFEPAVRGSDWLALDSLDLRGHGRVAAGLTPEWGYLPLILNPGSDRAKALVAYQLFAHFSAAVVLKERLRLGLVLPVLLATDGVDTSYRGQPFFAPHGGALGDVRIDADVRLWGRYGDRFRLAAGVLLQVPSGRRADFAGDGGVRFTGRVLVAGDLGPVTYAAELGGRYRRREEFADRLLGPELRYAAAVGVRLLQKRLLIGPELYGSVLRARATPLEVLLGVHYALPRGWHVGAGVGRGFVRPYGAPELRVLASVEWRQSARELPRPQVPDRDGDGVADGDDVCPDQPGVRRSRASRRAQLGCPVTEELFVLAPSADGHVGTIRVDDKQRSQTLVAPYRALTLDAAGEPAQRTMSEAEAEQLLRQVPVPRAGDRDGDGVLDDADACPEVAGAVTPGAAQTRPGCPATAEQYTLLPSADGHVGVVSVEDARGGKQVLDGAYQTLRIDAAGGATHSTLSAEALAGDLALVPVPRAGDRDGDGVGDGEDVCPDQPGSAAAQANAQHVKPGCPITEEQVVLLPSPDGHVGAVTVTVADEDGEHKMLLERPQQQMTLDAQGEATVRPLLDSEQQALLGELDQTVVGLPIDRDGDGIPDAVDACPDQAGFRYANRARGVRRGCPPTREEYTLLPSADEHTGSVSIQDSRHEQTLDTPYASVSVDSSGQEQRRQLSATEVAQRLGQLGVPREGDRDGDGVGDDEDRCPEQSGLAQADVAHGVQRGCPATSETYTLLPSADGHVGTIAIAPAGQSEGVAQQLDRAGATLGIDENGAALPAELTPAEQDNLLRRFALPRAGDRDGDGLGDADDRCPDQAGAPAGDAARGVLPGCPVTSEEVVLLPSADGHLGVVTVTRASPPGQTQRLERAYQQLRVSAEGTVAVTQLSREQALALERGAGPASDRDGDGVIDSEDHCPDQAARPQAGHKPGQTHPGCPLTEEDYVVIPGADGHVGAITLELSGDGSGGQTVLGEAYRTVSVDARGKRKSRKLRPGQVNQLFGTTATALGNPPRHFVLFYPKGSDRIVLKQATETLSALRNELKQRQAYEIEVIGYTDSVGRADRNAALSARRAEAVRQQLIAQGIAPALIRAVGRGELEPLIPVPDNTPEPRNRRVVVIVR